ncbi:hypothetical protein Hanom_Chr09g00829441 [Helianthus anomalus]
MNLESFTLHVLLYLLFTSSITLSICTTLVSFTHLLIPFHKSATSLSLFN